MSAKTRKPRITEAEAERFADRRVQRVLATDSAYRNAENAEQQADREAAISAAVWSAIEAEYEVTP